MGSGFEFDLVAGDRARKRFGFWIFFFFLVLGFSILFAGNFQRLSILDLSVLAKIVQYVGGLGDDTQRLATALLCNCMLEIAPDRKSASFSPERFAQAKLERRHGKTLLFNNWTGCPSSKLLSCM
jgi:hypothetical protein